MISRFTTLMAESYKRGFTSRMVAYCCKKDVLFYFSSAYSILSTYMLYKSIIIIYLLNINLKLVIYYAVFSI